MGFPKICSLRNLKSGRNNGEKMDNWKATPRDNALLKSSNGAPIQGGCPTDVNTTEIKKVSMWPVNGLTILCYFLAAFPSLKVS